MLAGSAEVWFSAAGIGMHDVIQGMSMCDMRRSNEHNTTSLKPINAKGFMNQGTPSHILLSKAIFKSLRCAERLRSGDFLCLYLYDRSSTVRVCVLIQHFLGGLYCGVRAHGATSIIACLGILHSSKVNWMIMACCRATKIFIDTVLNSAKLASISGYFASLT